MRRSKDVPLTLLAALALSVTACRDQREDCVDTRNRLLPNAACQYTGGGYGGAHYIYGGRSGGHIGDAVMGGSISRGGFGAIGHSGGFGGGE